MTLPEQERERFCQVLHHSRTSLYRLAFSITRNSSDAQEAVAEAVCRAYERYPQLREKEKLPRWLLAAGGAVLYVLTDWWAGQVTVSVSWLYPLGFPNAAFTSADYFPLLPWFFLFCAGYFLWSLLDKSPRAKELLQPGLRPLSFLGRHSLAIYLIHQPALMAVFSVLGRIAG